MDANAYYKKVMEITESSADFHGMNLGDEGIVGLSEGLKRNAAVFDVDLRMRVI